jgi:hypothetical protein
VSWVWPRPGPSQPVGVLPVKALMISIDCRITARWSSICWIGICT